MVEAGVTIGDNTILKSHVVLAGNTTIGAGCTIYPFASIGHAPQDLKFAGEESTVVIGDNTVIREHVTINPGTSGGTMSTTVGNNCLLMVGAHVAHDCAVGDNVIMANNATLAGHVVVENGVVIGGLAAMHQFVRLGEGSMIGGLAGVEHDVPPFSLAMGNRAKLHGLNLVGLKRRGIDRADINALKDAYQHLFNGEAPVKEQLTSLPVTHATVVQQFVDFISLPSKRGLCHRA